MIERSIDEMRKAIEHALEAVPLQQVPGQTTRLTCSSSEVHVNVPVRPTPWKTWSGRRVREIGEPPQMHQPHDGRRAHELRRQQALDENVGERDERPAQHRRHHDAPAQTLVEVAPRQRHFGLRVALRYRRHQRGEDVRAGLEIGERESPKVSRKISLSSRKSGSSIAIKHRHQSPLTRDRSLSAGELRRHRRSIS